MDMRRTSIRVAAVWLSCLLIGTTAPAPAQQPDLAPRDMQDSALFQSRPKSRRAPARKARSYRRTGAPPARRGSGGTEIGVTFWRLRASKADDAVTSRDIIHEPNGATVSLTPERLAGDPELASGDRFRFAVETSRTGYLYVVNRPVYDDGVPRDPVLIFPTLRIRGGANGMSGGRLVELPSAYDSPPYFTIAGRPGARLVAEEVIVFVTPKPLEVRIGDRPTVLTNEQIAEWERRWGAPAERFESASDDDTRYTAEERSARDDPSYRLTRDGPAPRLLFRVPSRGDDPVFLRMTVRVRA